jgi:hypothetical protein
MHLKIEGHQWHEWNVAEACSITITIDGSNVIVVCQDAGHAGCNHRDPPIPFYECRQVYYTHKPESLFRGHPVGCVYASSKSTEARTELTQGVA